MSPHASPHLPALALLLLGVLGPAPAHGTTRFLGHVRGVEAWVAEVPGAREVSATLELSGGLDAEGQGTWGRAAAVGAWLVRGPSPHAALGAWERLAFRAGLAVDVGLHRTGVSVTLDGPPEALERALWLLAERLLPPPALDGPGEPAAESLLEALWTGAEGSRYTAVSANGDARDTVVAAIRRGDGGHTPFASRLAAARSDVAALETLAVETLAAAPARLLVAVPEGAGAEAARLVARELGAVPERARPAAAPWAPPGLSRPTLPPGIRLPNRQDGRRSVVVGWDLRGAATQAGLDPEARDAALLVLGAWLAHAGGPLDRWLVGLHAVAREVEAEIRDDEAPVLLVEAEVRGPDAADLQARVLEAVERLREEAPPPDEVAGAARNVALEVAVRWATPRGRVRLLAGLLASGRVPAGGDPDRWVAALVGALPAVTPEALRGLADWALRSERRLVAEVVPDTPSPAEGVTLNADLLSTYVRASVDLRCPPAGLGMDAETLLREKYGMTLRTHVALTRAVAQRPEVMRDVVEQVETRCLEYQKLRGLASADQAVALHEAVACRAGRIADRAAREAALTRIFRRYDLDPSWYRPLLEMYREDPRVRPRLEAIDARCEPAFGPAAPR